MDPPTGSESGQPLSGISGAMLSGLSRYEIIKEIARGGMGIVYRARHKALEMDVAIKLLRGGSPRQRFLREAKLLGRMRCPYVVRIHDLDVLPDGVLMLVMEWVEGRDLYCTMRAYGGRVPELQAVQWMGHVSEGMLAAAAEGI